MPAPRIYKDDAYTPAHIVLNELVQEGAIRVALDLVWERGTSFGVAQIHIVAAKEMLEMLNEATK